MKTNFYNSAKRIFILCSFFYFLNSNAQAPDKMSYQAVIRNASNALVANQGVGIKISILQTTATGTVVYAERQTPTTNANGLASIQIGSGTVLSGTIATIDWSAGPYFIKTETDPTGGTNYTITSTTQLMSVPYALNSKTTSAVSGTNFYVPRFSSNNTLTNSSIFDSGNVGIGTIHPVAKLDVDGQILTRNRMVFGPTPTGDPQYDPIWAIDNSNNNFRIFNQPNYFDPGSTYFSIAPTGDVSMTNKLNVVGSILTRDRVVLGQTAPANPDTSPIWAMDNSNNNFRIFNQPNISSLGSTYLSIQSDGKVNIPNNIEVSQNTKTNSLIVGNGNTISSIQFGNINIGSNAQYQYLLKYVSFTTSMPNANYVVTVNPVLENSSDNFSISIINKTTIGFEIIIHRSDNYLGNFMWGQNLQANYIAICGN